MGSKEFQELAMKAVFKVNPNIAISEMFFVWMVKVLQNNKALIINNYSFSESVHKRTSVRTKANRTRIKSAGRAG